MGLAGLAAVAFSGLKRLVLTDGSDVLLRVLEKNALRVKALAEKTGEREQKGKAAGDCSEVSVSTRLLEWGDEAAAAALREEDSLDCKGFDLLLGADVTYSLSALPALFSTAAMLLREEEDNDDDDGDEEEEQEEEEEEEGEANQKKKTVPTYLLGYVSRSAALDRAVPLEAERAGFAVEVVTGKRRSLPGGQEGWILCLTKMKEKT